jgi:4-amino-4-deoxy-L-arabinose transferase-like glycosyltransferase
LGLWFAAGRAVAPDFIWPPLGGWVLGLTYTAVGPSHAAVTGLQIALFLASGLLVRFLARKALQDEPAADLAAAFLLLDPQVASFTQYLWPEILHLFLMLAAAALLFGQTRPHRALVAASGMVAGLALLTKNILGPFVPVLAVAAALRPDLAGTRPGRRLGQTALFIAGLLTVTGPVLVNNGLRYGTWAIANASPLNVWIGLTDPHGRSYDANAERCGNLYLAAGPTSQERNAFALGEIRAFVERRGVLAVLFDQLQKQYPRLLDRESFFTDQLPGGRIATREARLSGPPLSPIVVWNYTVWGAVLALASFGIAFLDWPRLRGPFAIPALFLAYNALLFLIVLAKTRFRIPFLPALDLLAAYAVSVVVHSPRTTVSPLRLVAGAGLAAAALYAAFGG